MPSALCAFFQRRKSYKSCFPRNVVPARPSFRNELTATLRLAGPVVAAQLGQMSMGFVDTVMVGRLGPAALAGVALGNTTFFFLLVMGTGVISAVGPMVAQAHGAGTHEPIERSVRQGFWLALLLAAPAVLLLCSAAPILRALGQDAATASRAGGYLRAIAPGFLPALWFMALRSFVEGLGRPLSVTLITCAGVALNAAANYALMFGAFGLPALGLVGTGLASTLVFWFLFAALAVFVRVRRPFRAYQIFARLGTPDAAYFRALFRIGWPIGISSGVEAGLFTVTALLMGLLSTTALAAHQVAIQCAAFTFMVPLGVGIAGSVRVGQAAGRGDAAGAQRAGYAAIALAVACMSGAAVLFWTAPEALVALYLDVDAPANEAVVPLAVTLLGIAAVFQVVDGVQVAATGALRGLKDTRGPMLIAVVSYWGVGLSAGVALGFGAGRGATGLWWGLVLGLSAAALLLTRRFYRRSRSLGEASAVPQGPAARAWPARQPEDETTER